MTEIKWEEPPADARTKTDLKGIASALRAHPGQWAKVYEQVTHATGADRIKKGYGVFAPPGSFEAVSRRNGEGVDIYARYVGGDDVA